MTLKTQTSENAQIILEQIEKHPELMKFSKPVDNYHNPHRMFVTWCQRGDGTWYQGEVKKTNGDHESDGRGVFFTPG
jgi:hypothetical protein